MTTKTNQTNPKRMSQRKPSILDEMISDARMEIMKKERTLKEQVADLDRFDSLKLEAQETWLELYEMVYNVLTNESTKDVSPFEFTDRKPVKSKIFSFVWEIERYEKIVWKWRPNKGRDGHSRPLMHQNGDQVVSEIYDLWELIKTSVDQNEDPGIAREFWGNNFPESPTTAKHFKQWQKDMDKLRSEIRKTERTRTVLIQKRMRKGK